MYFLFVYIHTCIRIRKYFYIILQYYITVLHTVYIYICFAKTISNIFVSYGLSFAWCEFSNQCTRWMDKYITMDEIKLCIQWTRDRSKVKASNHACDNLYFKLYIFGNIWLNSNIALLSQEEIMKTLNHFTHKSANNLSFSSFFLKIILCYDIMKSIYCWKKSTM